VTDPLLGDSGVRPLTRPDAVELMRGIRPVGDCPTVEIRRSGAVWRGQIVALVDRPAVVIETEDGHRTTVVIEGATVSEALDE
jgi:hypothetical protein